MLNEKLIVTEGSKKSKYVVVPINYKEYDRQSSRPYSEPLKKQCWRLFQNEGDTMAELIPIWDKAPADADIVYKIRYIRRPKPIILVDLPDGLEIDGESHHSECELNKILHMDILNQAFQLALATKGGGGSQ